MTENTNIERFLVFTGKGGVGKTTLAMSMACYLKEQGKEVLYVSFEEPEYAEIFTKLGIKKKILEVTSSAEGYVGKKLGSKTLAKWVCETKFFKSLLSMLPGFSYVILLGNILELLHNDENLHIVLDSPSSGHAITMFESCYNFKEVFKSGLIVDDINKMLEYIHQGSILKVFIAALPTEMAIQESMELHGSLKAMGIENIDIVINNSLAHMNELGQAQGLPVSLKAKIELEKNVIENSSQISQKVIPHSLESGNIQVICDLKPSVGHCA